LHQFPGFRIGAACAHQLAQHGVHLALTYSTNLTSLNETVADIHSKNATQKLRISIHQVDVGSSDEIETMFQQIDIEHGQRPDILISNAGYGKRIPDVSNISLEEFDHTMNINLRAGFILVKGVVEHMKAQKWGRIIFMSSIAAHGGGINGCRKSIHYPWSIILLFVEGNR
jgi:3-oxoacyl-[acyl-carrier protein] reductase